MVIMIMMKIETCHRRCQIKWDEFSNVCRFASDNVLLVSEVLALQPPRRAGRTYRPSSWWWGGTVFWEGQSANLWYNHDVWYSIGTQVFYDLWHHYDAWYYKKRIHVHNMKKKMCLLLNANKRILCDLFFAPVRHYPAYEPPTSQSL